MGWLLYILYLGKLMLLPVAVIVVFVVAAQSCQRPQTDGIGEEDLGASIHPHLVQKEKNKTIKSYWKWC